MTQTSTAEPARPPLAERLASSADGIVEQIARDYGVSPFEVIRQMPAEHRTIVQGANFADIMQALTSWGEVLLIVHTRGIVLECAGNGHIRQRLFQPARRQPDRWTLQGRQLHAYRVRLPAVHGAGLTLAAVLQRGGRSDVQGVRAARREARDAGRPGARVRRDADQTDGFKLIAQLELFLVRI